MVFSWKWLKITEKQWNSWFSSWKQWKIMVFSWKTVKITEKHWKAWPGGYQDTPWGTPAGSPPGIIHCLATHQPTHPAELHAASVAAPALTVAGTCSPGFFRLWAKSHYTQFSQKPSISTRKTMFFWPVLAKQCSRAYGNCQRSFQRKNPHFQWFSHDFHWNPLFCTAA